MKNTMKSGMWEKDAARVKAQQKTADHYECWALSKKYSGVLMENIKSNDLYLLCETIHGQFLSELNGLNLNGINKNYTQVWITMVNTVKKGNTSPRRAAAIRLLHQTNCQRSQ